jgi:hypothetical protein
MLFSIFALKLSAFFDFFSLSKLFFRLEKFSFPQALCMFYYKQKRLTSAPMNVAEISTFLSTRFPQFYPQQMHGKPVK